jgi:hypothetical protein
VGQVNVEVTMKPTNDKTTIIIPDPRTLRPWSFAIGDRVRSKFDPGDTGNIVRGERDRMPDGELGELLYVIELEDGMVFRAKELEIEKIPEVKNERRKARASQSAPSRGIGNSA